MNTIWIVLPILTLLMFELGLTLEVKDFKLFRQRPMPVLVGLVGQIIVLPLLAGLCGTMFDLPPLFFIGLMLIACSPGGSSSNIFSMLAKGDVALSVSLTALSSIITLFTIPLIMKVTTFFLGDYVIPVRLPVVNLIVQNLLLTLLPMGLGIAMRRYMPSAAAKVEGVLSCIAFPSLILFAALFFVQYHEVIANRFTSLWACVTTLVLLAMGGGVLLSRIMELNDREQRTIVIEMGMQNAAQSIAIACSPFIFNNEIIAVPAIIYALMMNVLLLIYVGFSRKRRKGAEQF